MFTVLTLNKISEKGLACLDREKYACQMEAENPDAVIVRSASMHDMEMPDNLLAIARAGAGYNNIPVPVCTEKGICVFNTPGANANAVKELVICALFLTSRRILPGAQWCASLKGSGAEVGKLIEKGKSNFAGPEIAGKTIGVFGLGAIGVLVANAAALLNMKVVAYDPFVLKANKDTLITGVEFVQTPEELFEKSDYITLHAPLNDSTRGIVNAKTLAFAKDGVRVLNFARGELVDSGDILAALASGKCAAYATDFPTDEQLGVDGVIAIPHLGASTPESEENCAVMAAKQIADYLENGNVVNSVNLPALTKTKDGKVRVTVISLGDKSGEIRAALCAEGVAVRSDAAATRGEIGYAIFDTDDALTDGILEALKAVDGVKAVRII